MAKVKLKGFDKLAKNLDSLKPSEVRKMVKPALTAGAKEQRNGIKANIKSLGVSAVERKFLSSALKSRAKTYGASGVVGNVTGISFKREATGERDDKGKKKYANTVTVSKGKGEKVTVKASDVVLLGHRLEYGTQETTKQPFVRPAFESTKDKVEAEFIKAVVPALEKGFKKK